MVFSVKYRKEDGTLDTLEVEAETRAAVFPLLEQRGIKAIRVDEVASKHGGWNKPKGANGARSAARRSSPSVWRGIAAGALVVVLAVGGYFAFFASSEKPQEKVVEKKPATIKEVKPAKVTPKPVETVPEKPKKPFWEVDASETNGFNEVMQHKWRVAHRPKPTHTNSLESIRHRAKSSIFPHRSENLIAAYLTIEPGQGMIGTPNMRGITQDFLKSCEMPIVEEETDDEYTRNLKHAMNETKVELRQRMKNGENLEDILLAAHKEAQRLSQYKKELESEFFKYRNDPEHSDQDVADFIASANKLLEQKGVSALNIGPITRNRLKHLLAEEVKSNAKQGIDKK